MAGSLQDSSKSLASAPHERRSSTIGPSYHLGFTLVSFWPIAGLYIDGWAHYQRWSESFFTPWHAVLYAGVAAVIVLLCAGMIFRTNVSKTESNAYRLSLLGAIVFGASGCIDLWWHSQYGIEIEVNALISPPHLGLFMGGALAVSAPLRMLRNDTGQSVWETQAIRLASLTLLWSLAIFVVQFLHPLVVIIGTSEFASNETLLSRYSLQSLVAAEAIVSTVVLACVVTAAYSWYRLPLGSVGVALGLTSTAAVALRENWELLPVGPVAAIMAEALNVLVAKTTSGQDTGRLSSATTCFVFFLTYVVWLNATQDVWWDFQTWSGLAVLVALIGWLVSYAMTQREWAED